MSSTTPAPPKVSVIIPTYNRKAFLLEAINSVLAQTYQDFEVIVVDDGSTDGTHEIVESIEDPRVRYLYQENAGRSAARNRGLVDAAGEHVAFLDDDDLYLPDKLSSQVAFLQTHPDVGLVAGGAELIDEHGDAMGDWRTWEEQPDLRVEACVYSCPLMPAIVLLRRKALARLEHWFDPDVEPAEDTDFFLRLQLAGCTMAWDRRLVAKYRLHAGGSQVDAARYGRAQHTMLDRLFLRPDLPESLKRQEAKIRAHRVLASACRCYATAQVDVAQRDLEEALALEPGLACGEFPTMLSQTIVGTGESWWVDDPLAYVDRVFSNLPPSHESLRRLRDETLSVTHMKRVFQAHASGQPIHWRDWWRGVCRDPRWLRNRGVWAILGRALVGGRLSLSRRCAVDDPR